MDVTKTGRGFDLIEFKDYYEKPCYIQQSSCIDNSQEGWDNPGSSFLWMGMDDHGMHLSIDQVEEIITHLQKWAETGRL